MSEFNDWGDEPSNETNEVGANAKNSKTNITVDMRKIAASMQEEELNPEKEGTLQTTDDDQNKDSSAATDSETTVIPPTRPDFKKIRDLMTQDPGSKSE